MRQISRAIYSAKNPCIPIGQLLVPIFMLKKSVEAIKGIEGRVARMVALAPKASGDGEDTIWVIRVLYILRLSHVISTLWRGLGDLSPGSDSSLGVESEDDKEVHLSLGRHSSSMRQKRTE